MRVVYLCGEYPPRAHGGVGAVVCGLAERLARSGREVIVIGAHTDVVRRQQRLQEGVRVVELPTSGRPGISTFRTAWEIRRELPRWMGENVVIEGSELSFWALPSEWSPRSVVRLHGGHHFFSEVERARPLRLRASIERRSLRRAARIVGVSGYVADRTAALVGLPRGEMSVIYNGVDTNVFQPDAAIEREEASLLFVGSLCEKKGVRYLVQAVDLLHREGQPVTLSLVGRDLGSTAGLPSFLDEVLDGTSNSCRRSIHYAGVVPRSEIPSLISRASAVVLPSIMEAHPMAWIEAMSCGAPVIASDRGPGPEVIQDGVDGLLCNPTDPVAIATAIRKVLGDPQMARGLGTAARAKALSAFSVEASVEASISLYESVLADLR